LAAALLLVVPVCGGSLELYFPDGQGGEVPVGETIDFGIVSTGDYVDSKLRIRNISESAVMLERFRVKDATSSFTLRNHPSIPVQVLPGSNVDFRVRFRPTEFGAYSATLQINDISVLLYGRSPESLTLSVLEEDGYQTLGSGDVISFGSVERKSWAARSFRIQNPASESLVVESLSIDEGPFLSTDLPAAPLELAPGATLDFEVQYLPVTGGIHSSALSMGDRVFVLEGFGLDPVFPPLEILLESSALESAQQANVRVRLSEVPTASGIGSLEIEFTPSQEGAGDDPAVQFLTTGTRSIPLTVTEDSAEALLGSAAEAVFQTGTTAGTITFIASLGAQKPQTARASVSMPPVPVVIDSALARRTPSALEVGIAGYDNTQSGSTIMFRFLDTNGNTLSPGTILADVTNAFRSHFQQANAGGLFSLVARFPVNGDTSQIGAVVVQFANSAGNSAEYRLGF